MGHDPLVSSLISVALGLGLGARHAFEPDHLAAMTVLAAESPGIRRGAWLGTLWGIGHTLALLVAGFALAIVSARMPERVADCFELAVAAMLVLMGARAVRTALRAGSIGPHTAHAHGEKGHVHSGPRDHLHLGRWVLATRPLLVGMIHGLAGSGALTALVIAELPSKATRIAFLGLFGLGSVVGMAMISGLAGWPLARLSRRPAAARWVIAAAGVLSASVGVSWSVPLLARIFA